MKRFSLQGFAVKAVVPSVYDGDTITAGFPLPQCPEGEKYLWSCRLSGVDTPELRDPDPVVKDHAFRARDRVRELLIDKEVDLRLGDFDKYGRVLVSVELPSGVDLAALMINEGLALAYDGSGPRPNWSEYLIV